MVYRKTIVYCKDRFKINIYKYSDFISCLSSIRSWFVGRSSMRSSMAIPSSWFRRILGSTRVGNLSNKSILMVSGVGGGLESSIRKSNGEGSGNIAVSILSLSLLEVSLRVVISYPILISIWLGSKLLLLVNRAGAYWAAAQARRVAAVRN